MGVYMTYFIIYMKEICHIKDVYIGVIDSRT